MYHTLGQRKGLGIGGTKDGSEDPWYVVDKDVENNVLIVAQGHEHPRLMSVGSSPSSYIGSIANRSPAPCAVR